jgi:hypothetical protein
MQLININLVKEIPRCYPKEFLKFCQDNSIKSPKITSMNGKALAVMLKYKNYYWNRATCDVFIEKFKINSKDSIQLFNKHNQLGIKTSSGIERNKFYIFYPYSLSDKHKMRKNFKFDGTESQKNLEIDKIKSTILSDYINVDNSCWQIGHKNPSSGNNTGTNLVLQPPIQSKYRDSYIFIDTLTKMPLPVKLLAMIKKKEIEFTEEQLRDFKKLFENLIASI